MRRSILILPLLLALTPAAAGAATALRVDVNDLTDTSTVIVRGEVLSVVSKWTEDGSTIHTLVKLRVDRVLAGAAAKEITVTCPGGEVGKTSVPVLGVPTFVKGEKVVVFLWKNRYGELIPNAFNQGKFRIEKDAKTGKETAKNSLDGLAFRAVPDSKGVRRRIKRTPDVFALPDLEKKITDRVAALRKAAEEKRAAEKKAAAEKEKAPVVDEGKKKEPVVDPKKAPEDPKPVEPKEKKEK